MVGKFINELVTPTDSLNDDGKWSRRLDLWLPDKIFRKPGSLSVLMASSLDQYPQNHKS